MAEQVRELVVWQGSRAQSSCGYRRRLGGQEEAGRGIIKGQDMQD